MSYLYDFEEPVKKRKRGPIRTVLMVVAALVVLGAVFWISYPRSASQTEENIPVIRADAEPYRVSPEDPGGMEIPHRESTVFDTLREARSLDEVPPIENLLEDGEEPMDREELFAGLSITEEPEEETPAAEDVKPVATEITERIFESTAPGAPVPKAKPVAKKAEPAPASDSALVVAKAEPVSSPVEKKPPPASAITQRITPETLAFVRSALKAEEQKAVDTEPAAGGPASGDFYVQLGSVGTRDGAKAEWSRLRKRFGAELSSYDYRIQEADLGARGIFYRIQAGPVARDQADRTCASIKAQKPGGCLVVGR